MRNSIYFSKLISKFLSIYRKTSLKMYIHYKQEKNAVSEVVMSFILFLHDTTTITNNIRVT